MEENISFKKEEISAQNITAAKNSYPQSVTVSTQTLEIEENISFQKEEISAHNITAAKNSYPQSVTISTQTLQTEENISFKKEEISAQNATFATNSSPQLGTFSSQTPQTEENISFRKNQISAQNETITKNSLPQLGFVSSQTPETELGSISFERNEEITCQNVTTAENSFSIFEIVSRKTAQTEESISVEKEPDNSATETCHENIKNNLIRHGPNDNAGNRYKWTPLYAAVKNGSFDAVRYLIENDTHINVKNNYGWNALHYSACYDDAELEFAALLIEKGGNIAARTDRDWNYCGRHYKKGSTALDIAKVSGKIELVDLLLEKKIQENSSWSPLHYSAKRGNLSLATFMVKIGADIEVEDKDGMLPIHVAAKAGHKSIIEILLKQGISVNATGKYHLTPLHYAVKYGNLDAAKCLIENCADVDSKEDYGWNVLHFACYYDNVGLDLAALLIEKGVDINAKTDRVWDYYDRHYKKDSIPIDIANASGRRDIAVLLSEKKIQEHSSWSPLHYAAKEGNLSLATCMIDIGTNVEAKDKDGNAPMHVAATAGHKSIIKILLKRGASIDATSRKKWTPLHDALRYRNYDVAKYLIKKGANIHAKGSFGWNVLHLAGFCENFEVEFVALLIEKGADVTAKSDKNLVLNGRYLKKGSTPLNVTAVSNNEIAHLLSEKEIQVNSSWSPLHYAADTGNIEMARLMIDTGANVEAKDKDGMAPLHFAARAGHTSIIEILISKGANVNVPDTRECTPMHHAAKYGHEDVVEYLIERGADIEAKDNFGWTVLHFAGYYGLSVKLPALLLWKGANINAKTDAEWNSNGRYYERGSTPLDVADVSENWDSADIYTEKIFQANSGWSPLHYAASVGDLSLATYMFQIGADSEAEDEDGMAPIHVAAKAGHKCIIKALLDRGVNVNTLSKSQLKPIIYAGMHGNLDSVKYLIERGADIQADTPGDEGRNLLHYAVSKDTLNLEVIALLLEKGADLNAKMKTDWYCNGYLHKEGSTPLDVANASGNIQIADVLTEKMAQRNSNWSPLHYAAKHGNEQLATYMIEMGADIEAKDKDGMIPIDVSAAANHRNIIEILLKHKANVIASDTSLHNAPGCGFLDGDNHLIEKAENIHVKETSGWNVLDFTDCYNIVGLDFAALIIEERAVVNANSYKTVQSKEKDYNEGSTPLNVATVSGKAELALLLAEKETQGCSSWSLLHYAAKQGDIELTAFMIEIGANIEAEDEDGMTPVNIAALEGHKNIVEMLINEGANVNASNKSEWKPVHHAVKCGHLDVAKYLIDRGANIEAKERYGWTVLHFTGFYDSLGLKFPAFLLALGADINAKTDGDWNYDGKCYKRGSTPLDVANVSGMKKSADIFSEKIAQYGSGWTPLHYAAKNGDVELALFMIEMGVDIEAENKVGMRPIHLAIEEGHKSITEILVNKGANINAPGEDESKPIHCAVAGDYLDIAKFLIERGANIEAKDDDGWTVLHFAACNHFGLEFPALFLEMGADINAKTDNDWYDDDVLYMKGSTPLNIAAISENKDSADIFTEKISQANSSWSPLHYAAKHGNEKLATFMIDIGANIEAKDKYGLAPIHVAARGGHKNFVEMLVNKGVNVNSSNENQWTPLHQAVKYGHLDIAKYLIEKGANIQAKDDDGWTVLHLASYFDTPDLALTALLLQKGADINATTDSDRYYNDVHYKEGSTPLDVSNISEKKVTVDILTDKKAQENSGWSPLHYAAKHGSEKLATFMIDIGASIEAKDKDGMAAIHVAARAGQKSIVEMLVNKGVKVDTPDENECTPLHQAVKCGHLDIVKYLIKKGANIEAKDDDGWTVLHFASCYDTADLKLIALLLHKGANINATTEKARYYNDKNYKKGSTPSDVANISERKATADILNDKKTQERSNWSPLHYAAKHGDMQLFIFMVENGANVFAVDKNYRTVIDIAIEGKHDNIVNYIAGEQPSWGNNFSMWVKKSTGKFFDYVASLPKATRNTLILSDTSGNP